jgi:glutamate-1-semialdehyde 2,1-aminomutase
MKSGIKLYQATLDACMALKQRAILLTPFHNMALMSPATTEADVDRHSEVFREAVLELVR